MKHNKHTKSLKAVVFILSLVMLLTACGNTETNGGEVSPTQITLEGLLALSDVDLSMKMINHQLVEKDGAYYLDPSDYEDWKPKISEGSPLVKTPMMYSVILAVPYGEANIDEVAMLLAKRFIHYLMSAEYCTDSSFLITAYKDLSVTIYSEDQAPERYAKYEEENTHTKDPNYTIWYVLVSASYRFVGEIEGVGSGEDLGEDEWVTDFNGSDDICLLLQEVHKEQDMYSIITAG